MNDCTMRAHVDWHFAGTILPRAERTMREHLSTCDSCRDLYRRHLLLARLDPRALPAEERIARGLGLRVRPRAVVMRLGVVAAAAAAAALLVMVHPRGDGFSARGNVGALAEPTSRVFAYDVDADKPPSIARDTLRSGHELAFAYENRAAKRWLVIFGVDEHGHVYWFHPGWSREDEDPVAIAVEVDDQRHELPEAIRQRFDGTHLEIRSLFVDQPISVREVEALLRQHPRGPLPIRGAVESSLSLTVVP
jgi:hypothetical protein